MPITKLTTELVEFIPDDLEQGKIYVSLRFGCAIHLCACGCGLQTVTPFNPPNGWNLSLDENNDVTLSPSIGNRHLYPGGRAVEVLIRCTVRRWGQ